jgi:hypothetical protein
MSYRVSFLLVSLVLVVGLLSAAWSVPALAGPTAAFAAAELAPFQQNLHIAKATGMIGYLVHLPLPPSPAHDRRVRAAVGRFFYKGGAGYLAHVDVERLSRLMSAGLPTRILDKKKLADQSEHWYLAAVPTPAAQAAVVAIFEPLFDDAGVLLLRLRPADEVYLETCGEVGVTFSRIDEILWPPQPSKGPINLPYFAQINNSLNPYGTCQNTCLAMVLRYYGWKGVPDDITRVWGSKIAQTPEGGARVFNAYAQNLGLAIEARGLRIPYAQFRTLLAKGHPMIVHGYFTAGHVLIANSCNDTTYDCHDPAGRWNQIPRGSYDYKVSGRNQKYRVKPFDEAISPDGNVWCVEFVPVVVENPGSGDRPALSRSSLGQDGDT